MNKQMSLIIAAQQGDLERLKELVHTSDDANTTDENGCSLLFWIAQEGYLDCLEHLIECGANVNAVERNGFSPLRIAVGEGHVEVVRALVAHGAALNAPCWADSNSTALHSAAAWDRFEAAKILLINGADPSVVDDDGKTPLDLAIQYNHSAIENLIRDAIDARANQ